MSVLGYPEGHSLGSVESRTVDTYELEVGRGEDFRPVAARAIAEAARDEAGIQLGEHRVHSISGGLTTTDTGELLEVRPENIAVSRVRDRIQVHFLSPSKPFKSPYQ